MPQSDFEYAVEFVLARESYKSELPGDPGGRTIFGISAASFPDMVKKLWDMPKVDAHREAVQFYKGAFWDNEGCGFLPFPMNMVIFDTAINCGSRRGKDFAKGAGDWRGFLCNRVRWQLNVSQSRYTVGLLCRILALYEAAEARLAQ